jgi:hypothetical protein
MDGQTLVKNDFSYFTTQMNKLELSANLTLDIIEKDKHIHLIGKTDNPYINIMNMDGVVLNPNENKVLKKYFKHKKWNIGPAVGIGLSKDMEVSPYLGVGISYGLIQF